VSAARDDAASTSSGSSSASENFQNAADASETEIHVSFHVHDGEKDEDLYPVKSCSPACSALLHIRPLDSGCHGHIMDVFRTRQYFEQFDKWVTRVVTRRVDGKLTSWLKFNMAGYRSAVMSANCSIAFTDDPDIVRLTLHEVRWMSTGGQNQAARLVRKKRGGRRHKEAEQSGTPRSQPVGTVSEHSSLASL